MDEQDKSLGYTGELRKMLATAIKDVRGKKIGAQEARAIASLAGAMIEAARFDLELLLSADAVQPIKGTSILGKVARDKSLEYVAGLESEFDSGTDEDSLRQRIYDLLAREKNMKPRNIANSLDELLLDVNKALDHEWFEPTPDGYRIARNQKSA